MTRLADIAVDRIDWPDFMEAWKWRQGEHVSLVGPTGTGKTTAAIQMLHRRAFVVAIGTKPQDDTLENLRRREGYTVVDSLPLDARPPRVIVWPRTRRIGKPARQHQAKVISDTLDRAYQAGGWCVFVDELAYISRSLGLALPLTDIWQQGRAMGLSLIGTTQRPRFVPLDCYSAATHLFFWRTNDQDDLRRISGLNGADAHAVRTIVERLPRHDVLAVNTRTGSMAITQPPKLG